jgi:hypothetical protein
MAVGIGIGKVVRGEHNRKSKLTLEWAVSDLKRQENKIHISKSYLHMNVLPV